MRRLGTFTALITSIGLIAPSSAALAQDPGGDEPVGSEFTSDQWLSTDENDEDVEDVERGPFAGLLDNLDQLIAVPASASVQQAFQMVDPIHVTLLTTGVDTTVLGDQAAAVTVTGRGGADGTDHVGWGTWASSVLLQAGSAVELDVIDVYPGDLPNEGAIAAALENIDVSTTDAVLLAFPPADLVDPTMRMVASGRANDFFDAALDTIVTQADGSKIVGIPMDSTARAAAEYIGGWADKRDVRSAAGMIQRWERIVDAIGSLADAGLPVVAPAGDIGPGPQTILGLAGLSTVITVGAADAAGTVVGSSARGPSVHGTTKPDVVAPVIFSGVLPVGSELASLLDTADLIDGNLGLLLDGEGLGDLRTASASTLSAAAGLTASLAHLASARTDLAKIRGALMAAAVPTVNRDVLAEGAGVLQNFPTLDLLNLPLVSGPLDLGMEPDDATAAWSANVDVFRGSPQPADIVLDRWVGTGTDGRRASGVMGPDARPVLSSIVVGSGQAKNDALTLSDGRLGVWLAPGDNAWEPGVFCGYSRVTLIGTSSDVDTEATIGTGPVTVPEDVPTCLVEGMRLDVLNFYIHNLPAQDFTLALLPNLPVGMDVIEGPTMVLPVHPTKEKLYSKISGPDGYVTFGAVLPGFYRMRQFSDYSIDVAEQHPGGVRERNLGNPLTYSTKDALILPDSVCQVSREERAGAGPNPNECQQELLAQIDAVHGDGEVGYDKTTGRYFVELPGIGDTPIILGWAKKMQLTVISSRYVDAMAGTDWATDSPSRTAQEVVNLLSDLSQIEELDQVGRPLAEAADDIANEMVGGVTSLLGLTDQWQWQGSPEPGEPLIGSYQGLNTTSDPTTVMGMADYPFSLTTPNYKGSVDWNFTYELDEVAVVAIVEVGKERHVALFTPAGVVSISPIGTEQPIDPVGLLEVSAANGVAHLEYVTHPKGAPAGLLTLLALPLDPMDPARVQVGDMSMEVTTWQRIEWPPVKHDRDGEIITGHSFEVQPRWNDRQMKDQCHTVGATLTGGFAGQVCDEWDLFVHSGRYDTETFRILDPASGTDVTAEVRPASGLFHDPMRGVTDATLALTHEATVDGLVNVDQSVRRELRSNGEFFEVLHLPDAVVREHGARLEFQQADNIVGRLMETITSHRIGSVPISGYLRFQASHVDTESVGLPAAPTATAMSTPSRSRTSDAPASGNTATAYTGFQTAPTTEPTTSSTEPTVLPPAAVSTTTALEDVFVSGVAGIREVDGLTAVVPTWDLFDASRDAVAAMALSGRVAPSATLASDACCATALLQSVGAADIPASDTTGQSTARAVLSFFEASGGRADLAQADVDHLGVGVLDGGDGRLYVVLAHRDWDGTEAPEEPVVVTPPAGGGGGGGGGGAPAPTTTPTSAPVVEATDAPTDVSTGAIDDAPTVVPVVEQVPEAAAPATDAHSDHGPSVAELRYLCDLDRLAGPSREHTAAEVASTVFNRADTVVLAASGGFADALTGAPLAAALQAPLLLNPTDVGEADDGRGLADVVVTELARLQPKTVVLLGGPKALSEDVATDLANRFGVEIVRLSGNDRFQTATAIADRLAAEADVDHAYLVEGFGAWPDAVSAAAVAGWRGSPILLTERDRLTPTTGLWLLTSGVRRVTIVGGEGVVNEWVALQLAGLGISVERLSGTDRYATSAAVADHAVALGMASDAIWLATGRNYPDALAAGPAAAALGVPMLLVDGTSTTASLSSRLWLERHAPTLTCVLVVGGPRAISDEVATWARTHA